MPPSLWEIVNTIPGIVVIVLVVAAGLLVLLMVTLARFGETCDCPRIMVRRQDPESGWSVLTVHHEDCPQREDEWKR